jgi:transmembrane sensor
MELRRETETSSGSNQPMIDPDQRPINDNGEADPDRAKREALDWVRRLGSGEVSRADLDALEIWRMAGAQNRRAFAEANLLWDVLGKVATEADIRDRLGRSPRALAAGSIGRRALLGGALAASVAYVAVRPPLGLWPSVAELAADYRTATGEQRRIVIASGITIDMNTQTSLKAPVRAGQQYSVDLVSGQVAVSVSTEMTQPLRIAAAGGQIEAARADFDIRRDGSFVCVTCTEGSVLVTGPSAVTSLTAGQQITYGDGRREAAVAVDPAVVTSWKHGTLIFRDIPLEQVIAEINRYRPGKIILLNKALAERSIVAGFRLDRIGEAADYLSRAVGAQVRTLPGGVVLLT